MVRTIGASDLKPRKKRSDKGKRRKKYARKPTKKKRKVGNFVKYVSKRNKDDPIKIWFWEQLPMNKDSYKNFSKETRPYMKKIVYKPTLRIDVDPYQISNKELVEQLCLEHLWEGVWLMMGFSYGRNKRGIKPVKLCKVKITNHPEGLKAKMMDNYRLFRYWFWNGK